MTKVFVVHRHESCEGSSILGITKEWIDALKISDEEKIKTGFMGCDEVSIDEIEIKE